MKQNLDKCIHDITLPREEAVSNILNHSVFNRETVWLPYYEAYGRVLAEDIFSKNTLPNALTANRDGVAVYFDRFADSMPDTTDWVEGIDYIYANTGIGIAGDYDTEILIEKVYKDEEGHIRFTEAPTHRGQNTIPVGSELKEGDLLAKAGQTITPSMMALFAKGGHVELPVIKKPVVAFLPTGNELVPAGAPLPLRKNIDSNSILMRGKLLEWGAEPLLYPICKDNPMQIKNVLTDALDKADIIILNAGSSKGTDDFAHEVLAEMAEIYNQQVDTGPGKHTCYALAHNHKPIIGISGPTGGCDFSSEWYVKPLIDLFLGRSITQYPRIKAKALTDLATTKQGVTFMMGAHVFLDQKGEVVVAAARSIKDGLQLENKVNCFIPMRGLNAKAGDMVEIELRLPFIIPVQEPDTINFIDAEPVVF